MKRLQSHWRQFRRQKCWKQCRNSDSPLWQIISSYRHPTALKHGKDELKLIGFGFKKKEADMHMSHRGVGVSEERGWKGKGVVQWPRAAWLLLTHMSKPRGRSCLPAYPSGAHQEYTPTHQHTHTKSRVEVPRCIRGNENADKPVSHAFRILHTWILLCVINHHAQYLCLHFSTKVHWWLACVLIHRGFMEGITWTIIILVCRGSI